jgi:metal-responsive CopG/Arc/MetJ family transcriptional regulator
MRLIKGGKSKMDKAMTFTTSKEFIDIVEKAHWKLEKSKSELIRDAVIEYLEKHLPKEVREEIMKKGGK